MKIGALAQRLEQDTHNVLVPGSNPGCPTSFSHREKLEQSNKREWRIVIAVDFLFSIFKVLRLAGRCALSSTAYRRAVRG